MTITCETLALAAKAAGIEVRGWPSDFPACLIRKDNEAIWQPHTDHGQLLDLAMACGMVIDNDNGQVLCYCERKGWQRYQSCPGDFHSLAEAIITAAAEQQLAKDRQ